MAQTQAQQSSWFLSALTLIFITLKLTGHIDWSWWWVTAPMWGGLALLFLFVIIMFLVIAIREMFR